MSPFERSESPGDMYFPQIGLPAERGRSGHALAVLQMVFVLCVVVALIAAPPASGRMLLIPLGGEGRDGLARMAIDAGARLVAPGPLGGSLVVSGEGAALIAALMPRHVLVLSASIGGCGEGTVRP